MSGSEIVEKLLSIRGIRPEDRESFLHPRFEDLKDSGELDGIREAADIVLAAVAGKKKTVVFGDYDCDGVSATAILVRMFKALGADVSAFLPDRISEGYGMGEASLRRMLKENPDVGLVITVDNGIGSVEEIAYLKDAGISVVVTDHHLPSVGAGGENLLPRADALVNPRVSGPPEFSALCGAGVAFLLAREVMVLAKKRGVYNGPNVGGPMLVLAGIATVTDIMPLTGQNRIIVAEALKRFSKSAPEGLKALVGSQSRNRAVRSRDFGFTIGPRINASGRMASGMDALELLLCDDGEKARSLAQTVERYNNERKAVEQRMTDEAMAKVEDGASCQVIELPSGHRGVVGIVAARVLERLEKKVPVCVIADGHGSGRSPDGVNIHDAFAACSAALEKHGGHAAAGGFTVKPGKTAEFRELMCGYCAAAIESSRYAGQHGTEPELWIEQEDITLELAELLSELEPFGEGNEEPVFGIRGVFFSDVRTSGADDRHLVFYLRNSSIRGVLWNGGHLAGEFDSRRSEPCDLFFTLAVSEYGTRHVELRVKGYSAASPLKSGEAF